MAGCGPFNGALAGERLDDGTRHALLIGNALVFVAPRGVDQLDDCLGFCVRTNRAEIPVRALADQAIGFGGSEA